MATVTETTKIGPNDHGRRMTLDEFAGADFTDGWLYELARGVVIVTEVPDIEHGWIVDLLASMFVLYRNTYPGVIKYRAGGGECRLRLPGMVCDRHPDQAVYLQHRPKANVWGQYIPQIVVEVVSRRGEDRDYVEKREEYLRVGVTEYWIIDPQARTMLVLKRNGDTWREILYKEDGLHRTELLTGFELRLADLLVPMPYEDEDEDEEPRPAPEG